MTVRVALDPHRFISLDDVSYSLLLDQWSGIRLQPHNRDSLDAHDLGTTSYHVAVGRSAALHHFHPLVATAIDWKARGDDPLRPRQDPLRARTAPRTGRDGDRWRP